MKKAIMMVFAGLWVGVLVYSQMPDFDDMEEVMVRSDMALMQLDGLIPMRFGNALDGKPIANATVDIEGIGSFVTDSRGIITFPQRDDGRFSLVFLKPGFITTTINFQIQLSLVYNNWYSISPRLQGDFRFVLDWGEEPADLDIHFEREGGYHISWRNMHSAADGSVKLDRDDRNGYGPETITVVKAEAAHVYTLYVVDYTHLGNRSSRALSRSGAVIRLYNSARLLNTFTVPQDGQGTRWNVCRIVGGAVVPVNTIQ
ncbi:MAG: hypothetical protein LBT14_02740 [Treponema sp.]|jgi:hypothetical protein|nr:hypothetical protein [Treponema sp.]